MKLSGIKLISAIVLTILSIVGLVLMINGSEGYNTAGWILLAFVIAYLIFSYTIVYLGEVAVILVLGKSVDDLIPGWYYTPAGITKVKKEKGTDFQDELPTEPEQIYGGDGIMPPGMFPPIRIKFGQPKADDDERLKTDPYNIAMTVEVVPVVSWCITSATMFYQRMGNVENCRKILSDKAVAVFGDDFADVTPAKASLTLEATSKKLEIKLKDETVGWGIQIKDAYVKPFVFSHGLNKAVVGVSVAKQNAQATLITAEGEKVKRVREAEGTAGGITVLATAEKTRLVENGLARTDDNGVIIELLPDANTRVTAEAIGKLAGVQGTLVLGNDVGTMLTIKQKGGT